MNEARIGDNKGSKYYIILERYADIWEDLFFRENISYFTWNEVTVKKIKILETYYLDNLND